jgi:CRISPR-associated protein Csd1
MILQALKEYYDRKAADPDSGIAPLGWEWKEIPFLIVIDKQGNFLRLRDTREQKGEKLHTKSFIVPSLGEGKGSGIKANLFWENAEYMFGLPMKEDSKSERVQKQHEAFKDKIAAIPKTAETVDVLEAVCTFLNNINTVQIQADPLWAEVKKINQSLLLAIGPDVVTDLPVVRAAIEQSRCVDANKSDKTLCLVSGDQDIMVALESPIKGVQGAKTTGAHLVSVNNEITSSGNGGPRPAFASFMKEKGANSPIGRTASQAYTGALNTLLSKESQQKIQVGDATTIFWSAKKDVSEEKFRDLFAEPPKDNPDRLVQNVKALYCSVDAGTGDFFEDGNTRFHVLGLSPNGHRISVRFWQIGKISDFAARFRDYFEDLRIVEDLRKAYKQKNKDNDSNNKEHLPLWRLLLSTAVLGKSENIVPNLAGNVMRSILEGLPFPETLLQAAILRIKAEHEVTYPRAKIIKGCLNRKFCISQKFMGKCQNESRLCLDGKPCVSQESNERSLTMSLDNENTDIGYRLGRLFATLEKIQQEANPGINATIRDKFYASASSAPRTVFSTLIRLKNHHLAKLEYAGRRTYFEKLIGEICWKIPPEFPAHLNLNEQGKFAIGYYHQIQDFFTKKSDGKPVNTPNQTKTDD